MSSLGSEDTAGLGFERVVRNAPIAIAVIDASGRVIHSTAEHGELTTASHGKQQRTARRRPRQNAAPVRRERSRTAAATHCLVKQKPGGYGRAIAAQANREP